jgi:hypothetical protein
MTDYSLIAKGSSRGSLLLNEWRNIKLSLAAFFKPSVLQYEWYFNKSLKPLFFIVTGVIGKLDSKLDSNSYVGLLSS